MTPTIVCPSHGRAGQVLVFKLLPDIPLCVAKSQAPAYKDAYPDAELIVHPDEVVGIAPKRQWIVDNLGDAMMFDDDVNAFTDVRVTAGEEGRIRDADVITDLVRGLFETAEGIGAHVCGFSSYANPTMYRPQLPFKLNKMVSGHTLGLRKSDKVVMPQKRDLLTDDLFISALGMYHDRVTLTDQRFAVSVAKTWKATGGMADHRTWDRMKANEQYLQMAFGKDAIVRRQASALTSIENDLQLSMEVQW